MHIIVIHDHGPIDACLNALCQATLPVGTAVTVIDNVATGRNWEALFAQLIGRSDPARTPVFAVTRNTQRLGFSANNNQVLRKLSEDDCALLLNDDAIVLPQAIEALARTLLIHADAALVGAQLLNDNLSHQPSFFAFPRVLNSLLNAWFGKPTLHDKPDGAVADGAYPVDWVSAACVLVRCASFSTVGLLDEAYDPGYGEDLDWAWRFNRAGWKVLACPAAQVKHLIGKSFGRHSTARYRQGFLGLTRFLVTHYSPLKSWTIRAIWCIGLAARALLSAPLAILRPHYPIPSRATYLAALKAVLVRR